MINDLFTHLSLHHQFNIKTHTYHDWFFMDGNNGYELRLKDINKRRNALRMIFYNNETIYMIFKDKNFNETNSPRIKFKYN